MSKVQKTKNYMSKMGPLNIFIIKNRYHDKNHVCLFFQSFRILSVIFSQLANNSLYEAR